MADLTECFDFTTSVGLESPYLSIIAHISIFVKVEIEVVGKIGKN